MGQAPIPSAVSADKAALVVFAFSAAPVEMAPAFRHWSMVSREKVGHPFASEVM